MKYDRNKVLIETLKRLLRRDAGHHLRKIVGKTHAADLARVFPYLTLAHQTKLYGLMENNEQKGILLSELIGVDQEIFLPFVQSLKIEELAAVLDEMADDDAADILGSLPEDLSDAILKKMKKEESEQVEELLSYKDDTAGGIMVPDFIALREDMTAEEAIKFIQKEHADTEMPFYLYVTDEYGKLTGVSSLRQLVVVSPKKTLKEFMITDVFSVRTGTDQEEVAKLVARYDFLAVPVVDENNKLVGIVTVDDVIDIMREEATEDMLKMAGVGTEFTETKSVCKSMRIRLPWLFVSCLGGISATMIIGGFTDTLSKVAALAAFIPVISGMGGNIGTQSSTIVVRGLSTGHLNVRDIRSVVLKELSIGLLLGMIYGILMGGVAFYQYGMYRLSASVCSALLCSMSVAALVGSTLPMIFARFNIDPAVATGPFVTTSIDIVAVFLYFEIATLFLGL
ncbi:MAG: magnesium transporter [Desulfobacterales bacterium]